MWWTWKRVGVVHFRVILQLVRRSGKRRLSWRRHEVSVLSTGWMTCLIFIRMSWLLSSRFVFSLSFVIEYRLQCVGSWNQIPLWAVVCLSHHTALDNGCTPLLQCLGQLFSCLLDVTMSVGVILNKPLFGLPHDGLLVDMDFGPWPYIRCSGGRMNIYVYGQVLQRSAHHHRPLGIGLLLLRQSD